MTSKLQTQSMVATSLTALMVLAAPLAMADSIVKLSPMSNAGASNNYSNRGSEVAANIGDYSYGDRIPLRGRITTVPVGTTMTVRLNSPINSYTGRVGDPVTAVLENDIMYPGGGVAIPSGSEVSGQVVYAEPSGRMGKSGTIDIHFNMVKTPDGMMVPFRGHIDTADQSGVLSGKMTKGDNIPTRIAKGVGIGAGGTALGAVSGTAIGGLIGAVGPAAVFGTAAGGVAGIGYAVLHKGKEVIIPSGSRFNVIMDQEITVNPY
jgi:hypothetical protein